MSNVRQLATQEQIFDQASMWISKMDRGLSASEEIELATWLAKGEANRSVFYPMAEQWDKMEGLSRLSDMFPRSREKNSVPPKRQYLAMAASIVLAIFVGVFGFFQLKSDQGFSPQAMFVAIDVAEAEVELLSFETAVGEQSSIVLSDGTEVRLNTNTLISVAYSEDERLIRLERGELHVDVEHNPLRPLRVFANDQIVEAIGTAFNVQWTNGNTVELLVTDGTVRVTAIDLNSEQESGASRTPVRARSLPLALSLSAGEGIVLGAGQEVAHLVTPDDIASTLSWREGNLIFTGESLEDAMAEVGRYTSTEFVFLDDDVKAVRVAGRFKAGDMNALLSTLQDSFNINYHEVGENKIELGAR